MTLIVLYICFLTQVTFDHAIICEISLLWNHRCPDDYIVQNIGWNCPCLTSPTFLKSVKALDTQRSIAVVNATTNPITGSAVLMHPLLCWWLEETVLLPSTCLSPTPQPFSLNRDANDRAYWQRPGLSPQLDLGTVFLTKALPEVCFVTH